MFNGKKILALIPARGGSKGIKNKNVIDLNGKPLITYTIEEALKSKYIDMTVVSTDSKTIADVAEDSGAFIPFMRPAELASDKAKTIDAVLHAVKTLHEMSYDFDILVLLQPTQPLRLVEDIDGAIDRFFEFGLRGLASVSSVDDHPLLIRTIDNDGKLVSLLSQNSTCRRQDMPSYYRINGCIYINRVDELSEETSFNDNPISYVMPRERSVDIDELKDLIVAKYYLCNK